MKTPALPTTPARLAAPAPWCASGAWLRALLLVLGVLALAAGFGADSLAAWVSRWADAALLGVPLTLAGVLLACASQRLLAHWPAWAQPLPLLALLAAAAGWLAPQLQLAPALPAAASAAALAAALWQWEAARTRAQMPAAAAAQLADLQTRIRPHFLFNTLNTAIALVQINPQRAEQVLEDLAALFRAALGALNAPTTLGDEVALGQRYLAIEQLRFGERLHVRWEVDESTLAARLPALALQPLLENAVRHGVEPGRGVGEVVVRAERRGERVLLSITNTVPQAEAGAAASPTTAGHGIGLASVRERLRLLHDLEADMRQGPTADGHWRVSIGVPAPTAAAREGVR